MPQMPKSCEQDGWKSDIVLFLVKNTKQISHVSQSGDTMHLFHGLNLFFFQGWRINGTIFDIEGIPILF